MTFLSLPAVVWNSAFKWIYLFFSLLSLAYQKVTDYRLPKHYNFNNEEVWRIVRITGPNALKYGADKFARSRNATNLQFVKKKRWKKHNIWKMQQRDVMKKQDVKKLVLWQQPKAVSTPKTQNLLREFHPKTVERKIFVNTQLWMWLVEEVKSDAVKNNIA